MAEHERNSQFQIHELEWSFEKPLGPLLLRGRIDRVDHFSDQQGEHWLRIIDYKSGSKKLELDRLYHGLSLQLLAYLDIALDHVSEEWQAQPAGAFYFRVHDEILTDKQPLSPDEIEQKRRKKYRMTGFMVDDKRVIQSMDGSLSNTPSASSSIPIRILKSGEIHSGDKHHLLSAEQWQQLRTYVRSKMLEIGEQILAGNTAIAPYKFKKQTPCTYCVYQPVCQFDRSLDGQTFRYLQPSRRDEALEQITKGMPTDL
jgi:ATP-dependent helicase/nuclease subunit B